MTTVQGRVLHILRDAFSDTVLQHVKTAHEHGVSVDFLQDFPAKDIARAAAVSTFALVDCVVLLAAEIDELRSRLQGQLQDDSPTSKKVN